MWRETSRKIAASKASKTGDETMSSANSPNGSQYDLGLDKTPANYVPLSPLSFLKRSAAVYPDRLSAVYEDRAFA